MASLSDRELKRLHRRLLRRAKAQGGLSLDWGAFSARRPALVRALDSVSVECERRERRAALAS